MTPAGGGPWGFISDSANPLITNGEPDAPSIVLPLPIAITKRQAIAMIEKKFAGAVLTSLQRSTTSRAVSSFAHTSTVTTPATSSNSKDDAAVCITARYSLA